MALAKRPATRYNGPMIEDVANHRPEISALCARFHVQRLDLFGSAARETDFGPDSDIDMLVAYEAAHAPPSLGDFLALREALADLFGRKVDLIMDSAVKNPFIRAGIEQSRQPLHGA
jgi:predicted nucleotidyltransferase